MTNNVLDSIKASGLTIEEMDILYKKCLKIANNSFLDKESKYYAIKEMLDYELNPKTIEKMHKEKWQKKNEELKEKNRQKAKDLKKRIEQRNLDTRIEDMIGILKYARKSNDTDYLYSEKELWNLESFELEETFNIFKEKNKEGYEKALDEYTKEKEAKQSKVKQEKSEGKKEEVEDNKQEEIKPIEKETKDDVAKEISNDVVSEEKIKETFEEEGKKVPKSITKASDKLKGIVNQKGSKIALGILALAGIVALAITNPALLLVVPGYMGYKEFNKGRGK